MRTYIVDSFTDEPFKGNPAGVCFPPADIGDERMLLIAQELNLSETAFLHGNGAADSYSIRFFSPIQEIPLCGHATLASARVLFELEDMDTVTFRNVDGLALSATRQGRHIVLRFPLYQTRAAEAPRPLIEALGIPSVANVRYNEETNILLLEIEGTKALSELEPDYGALRRSHDSINGVVVTAKSEGDGFDFHSRYFWPWSGGDEDPVTGGTHTFLAQYWGDRLRKSRMRSFQSSRRSGHLDLEVVDDHVLIGGQAQIVLSGEMHF